MRLRLATRSSPLAMWQARHAAMLLRRAHPGLRIELVPMRSGGDRDLATPLHAMPSIGVFVKEVQAAVLAGEADAGVHSCKDLPSAEPEGLVLAAILRRADPRDALVGAGSLADLPQGARIGGSSLRRRAQLAALRPDLRFVELRGNVGTRLGKLAAGEADATLMAMAGLGRLGALRRAGAVALDPLTVCTPAPSQGAIAIDCRTGDSACRRLLAGIAHHATAAAIAVERELMRALDGGCSLPLGAWCRRRPGGLWALDACLPDGAGRLRRLHLEGPAEGLAKKAFKRLG